MKRIPMMLKLEGRHVVVIGGGDVSARRVPKLLEAGAVLTLISPTLTPALLMLVENGDITWNKASVTKNQSFDADVLFIATNDHVLNESLYVHRQKHQWVYIASNPQKSDIHFPATIERERLTVALSTSGASPTYARRLRAKLQKWFSDELDGELLFLEQARTQVLAANLPPEVRKNLLLHIASESFLREENRQTLFEEMLHRICRGYDS